jgi:16S rRNA (guanine966-N2)-methyltransferase
VGGARVLDLYAGTGALGIEALSRGAAHATFVECARSALTSLRENLAAMDLSGSARVVARPVARATATLPGPFDLIFADPPYAALTEVPAAVAALQDAAPVIAGFTPRSSRVYGDTTVTLYDGDEAA